MGQARVWIRPQRGFGSRAWGAARAFQTAGGPAGEDHACLLSPCWLQRALGQASGNPQGGAPSTQLSSGKGPHLLQAQPLSGAAASNCVWELAVKHKKDDPAAPTPWSSGFAPSPPPSGKIQWLLWAPSKDLRQSTIPPQSLPPEAPHRGLFYSKQTHSGSNFLLRLLSEADTSAPQVPGNQRVLLHALPDQPGWQGVSWDLQLLGSTEEWASSVAESGGRQLCPAQGSPCCSHRALGHRDHVCPRGPPPPHTHSPASLPQAPCSSYTRMRLHSCPWVKARSLRLHSHTWRDTHTFKGFSLQKGQHDCPCANWSGTGG